MPLKLVPLKWVPLQGDGSFLLTDMASQRLFTENVAVWSEASSR
jgi:hypothetical protein